MLGCIQPMSSPMMKRMLGFCCAEAGALASPTAANSATRTSQIFRIFPIEPSLACPSVSCIIRRLPKQEREVRGGAGDPDSMRPQLPQCADPRPIGELQPGQVEGDLSSDLVDGAAQLGDFVARESPIERQCWRR